MFLLEWTFVLRDGQCSIVLRNEICTGVKAAKGGINWLKVRQLSAPLPFAHL